MRRGGLLLAGWHLLASTNLLAFALDQLVPQTKTVASLDFPCAHHDCGCKAAEQCRLHGCCHPKPRERQTCLLHTHSQQATPPEPVQVRVTYFSAAQCAGHASDGILTWQKLGPHLPPASAIALASRLAGDVQVVEPATPTTAFPEPPDKIPV